MKFFALFLVLFSSISMANYELEIRATDLNYTWGDKADFPLKLYQVGVSYNFNNGFSFGVMGGESDKRNSRGEWSLPVELKEFFTFTVKKEIRLNNKISVFAGYSYSEYKEVVYGEYKPDCGSGETYGIKYRINSNFSVKASYNMYYTKISDSVGKETTEGIGVSLSKAI